MTQCKNSLAVLKMKTSLLTSDALIGTFRVSTSLRENTLYSQLQRPIVLDLDPLLSIEKNKN
jgi:hypothetical protein